MSFFDLPFADRIAFVAVFVSILSLGVTTYIARIAKRILPQEANKKQLEIVTNLIMKVVNLRDIVSRRNNKGDNYFPVEREMNIFDTARLNYFPFEKNHLLIFSVPLKGHRYNEIFFFLSNPLLPRKIADSLSAIRNEGTVTDPLTDAIVNAPYMIINGGDTTFKSEREGLTTENQMTTRINSWLKVCKDFHRAIMEWLELNGVSDINLIALELNPEEDPEPNA
jgi:hypothetical protein